MVYQFTARLFTAILGMSALLGCAAIRPEPAPAPEFGTYGLGMTYREAIAAGGLYDARPRTWPEWPPTAIPVPPVRGATEMRLVLAGECVTAIEATYPGVCSGGLAQTLAHQYGPPAFAADGAWLWQDGIREVALTTPAADAPGCGRGCAPSCALSYRLADRGLADGTPTRTHGIAACRAIVRRHETRFRPDTLHGVERRVADTLADVLGMFGMR